ncbi:MAG: aromatic-ring-hydroxylating dioxygenase [Streptosporangiales bacterium]|nr:aromatic-ring-hydroxylating dioxygenase [Streptosporangiales bacterium]
MTREAVPDYSDTSRWSYYVDPSFYADLVELSGEWYDDWPPCALEVKADAEALLHREARLLDEARFNEWLDMYSRECLYWVPVTPGGGDPRAEVSHAFDDRRRLTDRVYWLRTGLAFCQIPQSRTRRIVGNVEVLDEPDNGRRRVRSSFLLTEFRAGTTKLYSGWYGHALTRDDDGWKIRTKQVNLLDSEHGHENLTIVF